MELNDVGEVIARRTFSLETPTSGEKVIVEIGKPVLFPDSTDYFTPYRIEWPGNNQVRYAGGIDAIQSLQLAMDMIAARLVGLRDSLDCAIFWEGDENGDLGFPLSDK